jgi:hypothetical protein
MPRVIAILFFVLALAAATCAPVHAQVVRGEVTHAPDARPVQGALIRLISADSQQVAMLLTDRDGRFVLVAPRQGRYLIQVEDIRYTTTRTQPFAIPATGTIQVNVPILPRDTGPPAT